MNECLLIYSKGTETEIEEKRGVREKKGKVHWTEAHNKEEETEEERQAEMKTRTTKN